MNLTFCTCSKSVILEELHKSDMSSEEDVEEYSDYAEWNLGENEADETADGTQHFNEARFVIIGYVVCINNEQITLVYRLCTTVH